MSVPGLSLSDAVSGGLPGMAKQFGALQKDTAENIKTEKTAAQAATSDIAKSEAEKAELIEKAKQPGGGLTPPKLEPPPQKKSTQPIEMWGSAAMWAAALGGLLTRRPLINSLNAAGAVMNAFRAQDSEAAKTAFETWKVENENAVKMFEFANSSLKDQLTEINQSENTRLNNYKIVAQALGDEQAARMQTFEQAMKLVEERQRHADEMAKAAPEIQTKYAQLQSGLSLVKAGRELQAAQQSKDPQKIAAATANFQAKKQESESLNLGLGKSGGASGSFRSLPAMVANKYAQEHPDATAEDMENFAMRYGEKTKAARDFGTGPQGNIVRSLNVSVSHLETLRELGKALENGDVKAINAAKQRFSEEFSVPAPTNFDTAKSIVADEVAKGVIGGNTAQADRETLAASLRRSGGPAVIDGAINTFQKLLGGQLKGLRQQYERTTDNKDFDENFLSPETRQALEGGEGGSKGGGARGPAPAHIKGKPIWPEGNHWVYEDGSPVK